MIGAAIYIFSEMSGDIVSYATFATAEQARGEVKLIGTLDKDYDVTYYPEKEPNKFSFHLKDKNGVSRQVVLLKPKPMEFERAEQIVLTGKLVNNHFVATEMLTKCPSKYKNEELYIRS